jgi:hypothetical protein
MHRSRNFRLQGGTSSSWRHAPRLSMQFQPLDPIKLVKPMYRAAARLHFNADAPGYRGQHRFHELRRVGIRGSLSGGI